MTEDWESITAMGEYIQGMDGLIELVNTTLVAFPDLKLHIVDSFCEVSHFDFNFQSDSWSDHTRVTTLRATGPACQCCTRPPTSAITQCSGRPLAGPPPGTGRPTPSSRTWTDSGSMFQATRI